MPGLSETDLLLGLLAVALILVVGRIFAEIAQRLGQSEVLGELLAGVLLGPSVLGMLAPRLRAALFLTKPVAQGLSLLSWVGAILLLLMAGMEVDLRVLRRVGKASALACAFAVVASLVVGFVFTVEPGPPPWRDGLSLGVTLSVTAVSVVSSYLIEHALARRTFAQVVLVAGVASETLGWVLVALASSVLTGSPLDAARALVAVVLFFVVALTLGWRFTCWAMRRVADLGRVAFGQLSLVLVLTLVFAAVTQQLGLHPLLGAFVFGILLARSPRTAVALKEQLHSLTFGVFGPIFFVLAGMRVDVMQLRLGTFLAAVLLLFFVATVVKVGMAAVGATVGGMRPRESLLVGIGLNFKGGTDVVMAIVLTELGLLSGQAYTMYAVIAVVTVLLSVPLFSRIERTVLPAPQERARLDREEAKHRAYFPHVERLIVPLVPTLLPQGASSVADALARAKRSEDEFFDITVLKVEPEVVPRPAAAAARAAGPLAPARERDDGRSARESAAASLTEAGQLPGVDLTVRRVQTEAQVVAALLGTPRDGTLIALGAPPCAPPCAGEGLLTLGAAQDRIVCDAAADVLVVIGGSAPDDVSGSPGPLELGSITRILVPLVGQRHSLAAGDLAAYLAKGIGAELVLLTVAQAPASFAARALRAASSGTMGALRDSGSRLLRDAAGRLGRIGVPLVQRVVVAHDPAEAIVHELVSGSCQLVVLGVVSRGNQGGHQGGHQEALDLGSTVRDVLPRCGVPAILLVSH